MPTGAAPRDTAALEPTDVGALARAPGQVRPGQIGTQLDLFHRDVQPWASPPIRKLPEELDEKRQVLLAQLADSHLGTVEARVAHVLQKYPETRDSDTALALRYWNRFQADKLESIDPVYLDVLYDLDNIDTITRSRRNIQNVLSLFEGSARTRQRRTEVQQEFHQYIAEKRAEDPEIRFYLDETGNEPRPRYTGLAGLCILDWRQYQKYHAALAQWREKQGWAETIRFSDLGESRIPRAVQLLEQLRKRRSGVLFVGYAMPSRGRSHPYLVDLFMQIVVDAIRKVEELKCLERTKAVTVIKEAEEGFDSEYIPVVQTELARQLAREFPEKVYVRQVVGVPKGRDALLECADLIAGGMQRRALSGGRNPKDRLAEAVFNVTGFGDPREEGVVFRAYR